MSTAKNPSESPKIAAAVSGKAAFPCSELFGRGVKLAVKTGVSIRKLLCGQLGIGEAYLENRVQTIFLNGRPVDDVDAAVVSDGDVLSLSAAMPGLVGATLRRGGHLAAMRQSISYKRHQKTAGAPSGTVTVKLFNLVAKELGPAFLARGLLVSGKDLAAPLKAAGGAVTEVRREGKPVTLEALSDLFDSDAPVFFQVEHFSR